MVRRVERTSLVGEVLALRPDDGVVPLVLDRSPELISALRVERKLVGDMVRVLRLQRSAVTQDDIDGIDDSVFSAQRILLTLSQARTRRRTLLHLITGREDVPLSDFEDALGPTATPDLIEARDDLRDVAQTMARELEVNRRVLRGAIEDGDQLLRTLTGTPQQAPSYAPPSASADDGAGAPGLLIDRQV